MSEINNAPTADQKDLRELFEAYREAAESLEESHQALQREVKRLRAELEQKRRLAALGEMAAVVAHEIRNSLGSIDLCASSLERELDPTGGQSAMVGRILSGVRTINGIVDDLLAYASEIRINPSVCAAGMIVSEALERLAGQIEGKCVQIVTRIDPELAVTGDYELLTRAVTNLVLNAVQAAPQGSRVDIGVRGGDEEITMTVADSGPGVPAESMDQIFAPFFTTKESGSGLGLAIVSRIIEAHGASVRASNRPEGGAVFTVVLPSATLSTRH